MELTPKPNNGWVFSSWVGDLTGSETPIRIIIDKEKKVTGKFIRNPTVTALNCSAATNNGTLTSGVAVMGVVNTIIPYSGAFGGTHNGQTVTSTGVTGLTATLAAGTFANGSGNLTYTITGTPSAIGTASFAINIGGKTCVLTRLVISTPTVIAAGSVFGSAFVLRDGIETRIETSSTTLDNSSVKSIFLSGSDEYLAGYIRVGPSNRSALLWKNGAKTTLQSKYPSNQANSVFVNGNDVFVAGDSGDGFEMGFPIFWKNGNPVYLSNNGGSAKSVFVSNNIIYVAGYEDLGSGIVAKFWKNGVGTNLVTPIPTNPSTTYSKATSIFVNGTDVYVGGYQYFEDANTSKMIAKIWKNGNPMTLTNLPGDSFINAIFVIGTDVYAVGSTEGCIPFSSPGKKVATYWKNGNPIYLSDCTKQNGVGQSLFIKGSDVYVGGYIINHQESGVSDTSYRPRYVIWKNNTIIKQSSLGAGPTSIEAIVVK